MSEFQFIVIIITISVDYLFLLSETNKIKKMLGKVDFALRDFDFVLAKLKKIEMMLDAISTNSTNSTNSK